MSKQIDLDGLVVADAVYRLDEIQSRLKLGTGALRAARRAGLPVKKIGRRSFILGSDVIAFLERANTRDS